MAGTLTVDALKASTGVLATQNGMTGIAKAWCNWQGGEGNTAGTINQSFNVSSITVNTSGDYTVNFTTTMANANYVVSGGASRVDATTYGPYSLGVYSGTTPTTTAVRVIVGYGGSRASGGIPLISPQVYIAIFGA